MKQDLRIIRSSIRTFAKQAALLILAILPGLSLRAQIEEILVLDFNDAVFGSNWISVGDPAQFVSSPVDGNGLRLLPEEMQSVPASTAPYYPVMIIPIPGGYSPDHGYQLEAYCYPDLAIPGIGQCGLATLGWFDGVNFYNAPQILSFGADPFNYGITPWHLGGPPTNAGTFAVALRAQIGPNDIAMGATFDNVMVRRKPYGTSLSMLTFVLNGAYDTGLGRMRDNLRQQGLIPLLEPYTAMGYPQINGGGEVATSFWLDLTAFSVHRAVDWVRVELRDQNDPTQLVASGQYVLWSNGRLRQSDNGLDVVMKAPPGNYYVVVRHRNHLAAMTAAPVFLSSNLGTSTVLDLTQTATATYGTNAQQNNNGTMCLWPGDANFNGDVKYTGIGNDRDLILTAIGGATPTNTVTNTYSPLDINMDGTIRYTGTNNDRDIILETIGGVVPTATRAEQLP
ncbi:MAG: hypothetical protein IPF95_01465 [Flavobacteriales bacterium]|nr:hypothetical protein [Flavobacteriales bacterium]